MKKKLVVTTFLLLIALLGVSVAQALSPIRIMVDGIELETDVAPNLVKGRVLVPVRAIAEKFGAEVIWDGENKTVHINTKIEETEDVAEREITDLVATFGKRLQKVSLFAPETILMENMRTHYGDLVTEELLDKWILDPHKAPGRALSSPWPEQIEILSIEETGENMYWVKGNIIEVTSVEMAEGGFAAKRPIDLTVERRKDSWLITGATLGPYDTKSVVYKNNEYGFSFSLPDSWQYYTITAVEWEGFNPKSPGTIIAQGPLLFIRHPKWTIKNPRQDIPIMIFTHSQWEALEREEFHIGAAPMGPKQLGSNDEYVFALPARYNYAFWEGFEEVESILENNPLTTG